MSFNKDELEAPGWMNAEFLKDVLEFNGKLKNVTIEDYKMSPATAFGDHFASIMFRANITYSVPDAEHQSCSVIIKTLPVADGMKKDILCKEGGVDLFGTETLVYTKVLDKCGKILQQAGYTDSLAAKLLYHSQKPQKVIVFEDLKPHGYFMFPRTIPDDHEAGLIFSKLAQFHAATYQLAKEACQDVMLKGTIFNMPDITNFPTFTHGLTYLTNVTETLPGFETISEKLRKINIQKLAKDCEQRVNTPGSFNVLNHGDYHIKNMMFKGIDENTISEVILVDFQICHWGSPAYDLYYISSNIASDRREKLFRLYFDTFIDVLTKSGYKGDLPTYVQLQQELKTNQCLDFFFLSTFSPFFFAKKDQFETANEGQAIDMEVIMTDMGFLRTFYDSPQYIAHVKGILPVLLAEGVLDREDGECYDMAKPSEKGQ